MSHVDAIISTVRGAFKRRALAELYSKPAPFLGHFQVATYKLETGEARANFRERMRPAKLRHEWPYEYNEDDEDAAGLKTTSGIVFTSDRFLEEPIFLEADYGTPARENLLAFKRSDKGEFGFVRDMQSEMTTLGIQVEILQHSGPQRSSSNPQYSQYLLFVPFSRVEYINDNPDLPIETNHGDQIEKFLAYLLVKGLLEPTNEQHLRITRETFLVYNPDQSPKIRSYVEQFKAKLDDAESVFKPHEFPKFSINPA